MSEPTSRPRIALCLAHGSQTRGGGVPIGLGSLITFYQLHGVHRDAEFKIFDEYAAGKDLTPEIIAWNPTMVGVSAMSVTASRALEIGRTVRAALDVPLVAGGVHFQVCPEDAVEKGPFDVAVYGEGEEPLRRLIDEWLPAPSERSTLARIPNLAYVESGALRRTEPWVLKDLEALPIPAPELYNLRYYLRVRQYIPGILAKSFMLITSRGCPYSCAFCTNSRLDRTLRTHSIGHVIEHIRYVRDRYGVRYFDLNDELFVARRKHVREFCDAVRPLDVHWSCQARPDNLAHDDLPMLRAMKEAGCITVGLGLESGSNDVLRRIKGPKASVETNQAAIDLVCESGLDVFGNLMCGIPYETEEQMEQTGEFILANLHKMRHFGLSIFIPFPGCDLYGDLQAAGLLDDADMDMFGMNQYGQGAHLRSYNPLVSTEKVVAFHRRINRAGIAKWGLRYKVAWLIIEMLDDPVRTLRRLRSL